MSEQISRRRFRLPFLLLAVLLAAFAVLAILQYRWIGEVSEAERQRLQNSVQLATSRFAEEFNSEVTRALMELTEGPNLVAGGGLSHYGELYLQWQATTAYPQIIRNLFIVEIHSPGQLRLSRFDTISKMLRPATWPLHLTDVKDRLSQQFGSALPDVPFREIEANLLLTRDPPTAVLALPLPPADVIRSRRIGPSVESVALPLFPTTWAIVEFNQDCIVNQVFPDLVNRYISALGAGEYHVSVASRSEPRQIIYQSDPVAPTLDFAMADSGAELFRFIPRRVVGFAGHRGFAARPRPQTFTMAFPPRPAGHWDLFVEHHLGSLDAAVDQLRRRNLAVSFGILLVLVASVVMIIIASERARALARLQMEFAAGISHELRTPLTVIQALTHNLTTGIVRDPVHVKEYARMVQCEARGLSSIVDQVLLFAETRSIRKKYDVGPVEVVEVVDHALAALASQIQEVGSQIVTDIPDDLPVVRGSAIPLTHCIRNLISNALKYGYIVGGYSTIQVKGSSNTENNEVRISVIDNGSGIDPGDFPHIFEAFYRGRTISPGTRGAGLGLYLVKHLIEAQGGRITFESRSSGSTFVLHIPTFDQELRYGSAAASG